MDITKSLRRLQQRLSGDQTARESQDDRLGTSPSPPRRDSEGGDESVSAHDDEFDPAGWLDSVRPIPIRSTSPGQDFVIFSREPAEDHPPAAPTHLPILPLKDTVVFPETVMPLAVGQPRSVRLIDDVLRKDKLVGLVASKDPSIETPGPGDVYTVGVLASIQKMLKAPDGTLRIIAQGIRRIQIERFASEEPYLWADVHELPDVVDPGTELEALQRNLVSVYTRVIQLVPYLPDELEIAVANIDDPAALGYFIASTMRLKTEEKQELLSEVHLSKRLRRLTAFVNRELEVLELGSKIQDQVQSEMDKNQREYVLRQQLKAIQEELGETDETQAEVNELREPDRQGQPARRGGQAGPARAGPAVQATHRRGRIRGHPHLSGLDSLAALVGHHHRQPGHRPRPPGAWTRTTTT